MTKEQVLRIIREGLQVEIDHRLDPISSGYEVITTVTLKLNGQTISTSRDSFTFAGD